MKSETDITTGEAGPDPVYATTLDATRTVAPAVPAPPAHDPFSVGDVDGAPAVEFDETAWVEDRNPAPTHGWRRTLWRLTGGRYAPAPSADEQRGRALLEATRRPFGGARTIAVVSTKGGVGKTTTALNLGHTLAAIRGDRVVALDANPDAGSLGYRVRRETQATAADLLAFPHEITSYAQIRSFTSQASSRLEVIASDDDPRLTRRLGRREYERLLTLLRRQYNLILADCGTGILDSATRGVVQSADQLVVVTGPSVDAARAVTYLLAWLREHGMAKKVQRAVVVVNGVRPGRRPVDVERVTDHFRQLVRDVVVLPWDAELSNGAAVELEWLDSATRQAYLGLAATLVEEFVTTSPEMSPISTAALGGTT
ncbi:N/A [soil metagenome]